MKLYFAKFKPRNPKKDGYKCLFECICGKRTHGYTEHKEHLKDCEEFIAWQAAHNHKL